MGQHKARRERIARPLTVEDIDPLYMYNAIKELYSKIEALEEIDAMYVWNAIEELYSKTDELEDDVVYVSNAIGSHNFYEHNPQNKKRSPEFSDYAELKMFKATDGEESVIFLAQGVKEVDSPNQLPYADIFGENMNEPKKHDCMNCFFSTYPDGAWCYLRREETNPEDCIECENYVNRHNATTEDHIRLNQAMEDAENEQKEKHMGIALKEWLAEHRKTPEGKIHIERVKHAITGDVHAFTQYDGFMLEHDGDCVMRPDKDGDCLMSGSTFDLRHSGSDLAVRVQIHKGTSHADAVRLMKKLTKWVEKSPDDLDRPVR